MRPPTLALLWWLVAIMVSVAAPAIRSSQAAGAILDLGHPLSEQAPSWTGQKVFSVSPVATMAKDGYFARRFCTDEHFGTHLDAPAHFAAAGWTVDRIPAERLIGPGVCINIASLAQQHEDYRLTVKDVHAFEARAGVIPEGSIVLVATGWDARWQDRSRYMNERANVKHFPGLSVEAATFLARDRKVAGIGIDTASIDYGPSGSFEAHHATQPHNVYHVENAANLIHLPATGFTVVVAPIALVNGSGGPTRVFALLR